ncbi:MAG: DedA family protein [Candidatus Marinimicrobia bacterium]|jgi:membrane protein YqaA with SNARE-associated domain|nr:DedA family protein [Candidatus Neomarinimicrobiota bacterium]MBT3618182.1 DedA family protein [Candidatus Neomarinimicrobiota bacterium]MBT3828653.1 DedA family protein [Candidatus Neomarinimicrobiota bacterium]MBT3996885.1 DedA family protein [Candidatus Neomarinimicrobiota bacterium]MBT4280849.1 DedA family protein [Candidatus Neomarinimicrobiota bacterium]
MHWIRKIYDWMLHWAETPYGPIALFFLALAESSFFPIPPDALLIALALGLRTKSLQFALLCSVGSVIGALIGYGIGHYLWWNAQSDFSGLALFFFNHIPGFSEIIFNSIQSKFEAYNFWIVFTAGFTPIPFKVFTISAGAFDVNIWMFLIASTVSRSARFFLVGWLIWKYGDPIREFIEKYFNILAIIFTILLIGGFILIKVFI